jgi:hypothetical protein
VRFIPPPGKLLGVVATARSDERVGLLDGGFVVELESRARRRALMGETQQGECTIVPCFSNHGIGDLSR